MVTQPPSETLAAGKLTRATPMVVVSVQVFRRPTYAARFGISDVAVTSFTSVLGRTFFTSTRDPVLRQFPFIELVKAFRYTALSAIYLALHYHPTMFGLNITQDLTGLKPN